MMTSRTLIAALLVVGVMTSFLTASEPYVAPAEPALLIEGTTAVYYEPIEETWDSAVTRAMSDRVTWREAGEPSEDVTAANGCGETACEAPACHSCCDCLPPWAHRTGIAGEFLYLRARNAEVAYAVPIDGAIVPPVGVAPIQVGRMGATDPDYSSGFRVAATFACDNCSSLIATYSRLSSDCWDAIAIDAPLVIRSTVLHPGSANAAADFLQATGNEGVDFNLCDIDYRFVWISDQLYAINLLAGLRYARLDQDFQAFYTLAGSTETAQTDISFDGGGIRLGIDAERHQPSTGLFCYGKSDVDFVAGEFRARYFQGNTFDPVIVDTTWKAGRIVTMLDLELGMGWQSTCGTFRFTAGYLFNSWMNTVQTGEFIRAVQTNDLVGLGDTLTFDGVVTRAEIRF